MIRKQLRLPQQMKVGQILMAHREDILRERQPYEALAEKISKEVKFLVTGSNVKTCLKAVGMKYFAKRNEGAVTSRVYVLRVLRDVLGDLATLHKELGVAMPQSLAADLLNLEGKLDAASAHGDRAS